jgi:hypothetical protein
VPSDAVEQSWDEAAEDGIASAEVENRELTVGTEHHGQRVDKVLALGVSEFSRSYLQQLLADGAVTLNGKVLQALGQGGRGRPPARGNAAHPAEHGFPARGHGSAGGL